MSAAVSTTRRGQRGRLTPLGEVVHGRTILHGAGRTRREVWAATSTDGRWRFERLESSGTPWAATFLPTGQQVWFGSLPKARRWTAAPGAVAHLRRTAQAVVDADGVNEGRVWPPQTGQERRAAVAAARRIVEIIDGLGCG